MKQPKIVVDKRILRGFRRRALKAYPLEHMESVHGRILGKNLHVYSIHPFDEEKATKQEVEIKGKHVEQDEEDAFDAEMLVLGTLHSHPDELGAEPSEHDWNNLSEDALLLGICAIRPNKTRRSTRIRFYLAQKPLPVKHPR